MINVGEKAVHHKNPQALWERTTPAKEQHAMAGTVPGFLPKAALTTSRAVYYPFTIPQKLNDSATLVGHSLNGAVAGIAGSVGQAYVDLKPRGPAKWLVPLFTKTLDATQKSEAMAQRNKAVFWDPFSQGVEGVGRAIAGPGAYYYLHKAGVENPSSDAIKAVLNLPLFKYPSGEEVSAFEQQVAAMRGQAPQGPPPQQQAPTDAAGAAEQAPPPDAGAQGAAEGAGQAA